MLNLLLRSMQEAKLPNIPGGNCPLQDGLRTLCLLVEGNQFNGQLGKAFGKVSILGFNHQQLADSVKVVVEGAFKLVTDGEGILDAQLSVVIERYRTVRARK
ncbi:hypothetical protein RHP47_11410 [Thermosynechococcus sp. QKsg1]|nr:hypothetical protein MZ909_11440 [Thermosynechococcus sp. B0]WNC86434.1 hypothetical protein RHP47_11410 [Thermosynechococcus sp. QKsg1]